MKPCFKPGELVTIFNPRDAAPHGKTTVARVDKHGVWTTNKLRWTCTGLQFGKGPGPNRVQIRPMTAEDDEYFECRLIAGILERYPWRKLPLKRLTQVLLCLPPEVPTATDKKEQG
jgi:hypothetical protein